MSMKCIALKHDRTPEIVWVPSSRILRFWDSQSGVEVAYELPGASSWNKGVWMGEGDARDFARMMERAASQDVDKLVEEIRSLTRTMEWKR